MKGFHFSRWITNRCNGRWWSAFNLQRCALRFPSQCSRVISHGYLSVALFLPKSITGAPL
jgi:hypothetical protein